MVTRQFSSLLLRCEYKATVCIPLHLYQSPSKGAWFSQYLSPAPSGGDASVQVISVGVFIVFVGLLY